MIILKSFYRFTFFSIFFISCKSIHKIQVPPAIENSIEISAKKEPLTEIQKQNWNSLDILTDTVPGMSLSKAYDFLEGKKHKEVIVAVNDSGIDLEHRSLKHALWTNTKEIAGNGIDDDKNSFVDDIHGWNFLGDIYDENLEITRIIRNKYSKFHGKNESQIDTKDKEEYKKYISLKEIFDKKLDKASKEKRKYSLYYEFCESVHNSMIKNTGKEDYSIEDVSEIKTADRAILRQKEITIEILQEGASYLEEMKQAKQAIDYFTTQIEHHYNLDFNPREILEYDENDYSSKNYGDADVNNHEDDEIHGTHVSGIILASIRNSEAAERISKNIKLMAVRCVPNGDEYDKDVALAIRYAVDNGAKIINTSFGKEYSPYKKWVYDAIRYAEKHDVLIVNAAGNDARNIDIYPNYPNDTEDLKTEISDNMITVGAIGYDYNKYMVASFSNYGKINVDIFAPGLEIYSSIPNNEYNFLSGTSMAAPSTVKVASIIRSYFPKLSASQVKHILINSGTLINFKVIKPGTNDELVSLSDLCFSGRIINAYNAVKMASEMVGK